MILSVLGMCLSFSMPAFSEALPSHAACVHVWDLVSAWLVLGVEGGLGEGCEMGCLSHKKKWTQRASNAESPKEGSKFLL